MPKLFYYSTIHLALILALNAQAADKPNEEKSQLESIIVIGKKPNFSLNERAGSVDYISAEELAYEHVDDTIELFSKVPGVYLSRFNQGILNTTVAMRGYSADGHTPHAKLLIDGIPSNVTSGVEELDQMFPLAMGSMTVFKGTSDPSYGLFNIAGNYQVESRSDIGNIVEMNLGSYNAKEFQAYSGSQTGKLTQNYFFGYRQSEGYRDHTDLDKFSLSGRWAYELNEDTQITTIARMAGYKGDAPGYLTKEQVLEDPSQSADYSKDDGGEKSTAHLSIHLDHYFSDDIQWQFKAYNQHFERERRVRWSEDDLLDTSQDDQDVYGFTSKLSWEMANHWTLTWGLDSENHNAIETRYGTDMSVENGVTSLERDYHYDINANGSYLKVGHEWQDMVRWNIGVRADQLSGNFVDYTNISNPEYRDMYDFGTLIQPTANIIISPSSYYNIFANYGESFQHPLGADAYTDGDTKARDVSLNTGWELGTVFKPLPNLDLRLSYWVQDASEEFIMFDGEAQNIGETHRHGFDMALSWQASENIMLWGNYTTINSEVITAADGQSSMIGNEIIGTPEYSASIGVNYEISEKLTARLHLDAQGDYYVNSANLGEQYGDYALVNASLAYDLGEVTLRVQLNNITNEYYEYVYDLSEDGSATIHSPGEGRNFNISVSKAF